MFFIVKTLPRSFPVRRATRPEHRAATDYLPFSPPPPIERRQFRHIETKCDVFSCWQLEPHRGQMKASPTEKERTRQRRPATGWTTGVLCCLNAIMIPSVRSIFGYKTSALCISQLTKPTAAPSGSGSGATAETNFSSVCVEACTLRRISETEFELEIKQTIQICRNLDNPDHR